LRASRLRPNEVQQSHSACRRVGLLLEERNDLFEHGAMSKFGFLAQCGEPVGNYFAMRSGTNFFAVILGGTYFDAMEA
jgi:hypothetical protein